MSHDVDAPRPVAAFAFRMSRWMERAPRLLRIWLFAWMTVAAAFAMIQVRGWLLGVVAGLFYGVSLWYAISPERVRAWSAKHVVADSAIFIPAVFFALLLVLRHIPVWAAALVALAAGAVVVPRKVRRRREAVARAAEGTAPVRGPF